MNKTKVLNTRPQQSLETTRFFFEQKGFDVIDCPCIEIVTVSNKERVKKQLKNISPQDVIVFTSQHAVSSAYKVYSELCFDKGNILIAVGAKTSELLEQHTDADIWVPAKKNSQGVIELLKGLKIINTIQVVTAVNGLDEIQQYARETNNTVNQINVYQRRLPKLNNQIVEEIQSTQSLIVLATSATSLHNLKTIIPENIWKTLLSQNVLCASNRIKKEAESLGFKHVLNANSANSEEMASYLCSSS